MFIFLWELNACVFWHLISVALLPWHFIAWFKVKRNLKLRLDKIFKDKPVDLASLIVKHYGSISFMSCNGVEYYFSVRPGQATSLDQENQTDELDKSGLVEMNLTLNQIKEIQRELFVWSEEWIPFVYTTIEMKYTKQDLMLSCGFLKFLSHSPYRLHSSTARIVRLIFEYFKKTKST